MTTRPHQPTTPRRYRAVAGDDSEFSRRSQAKLLQVPQYEQVNELEKRGELDVLQRFMRSQHVARRDVSLRYIKKMLEEDAENGSAAATPNMGPTAPTGMRAHRPPKKRLTSSSVPPMVRQQTGIPPIPMNKSIMSTRSLYSVATTGEESTQSVDGSPDDYGSEDIIAGDSKRINIHERLTYQEKKDIEDMKSQWKKMGLSNVLVFPEGIDNDAVKMTMHSHFQRNKWVNEMYTTRNKKPPKSLPIVPKTTADLLQGFQMRVGKDSIQALANSTDYSSAYTSLRDLDRSIASTFDNTKQRVKVISNKRRGEAAKAMRHLDPANLKTIRKQFTGTLELKSFNENEISLLEQKRKNTIEAVIIEQEKFRERVKRMQEGKEPVVGPPTEYRSLQDEGDLRSPRQSTEEIHPVPQRSRTVMPFSSLVANAVPEEMNEEENEGTGETKIRVDMGMEIDDDDDDGTMSTLSARSGDGGGDDDREPKSMMVATRTVTVQPGFREEEKQIPEIPEPEVDSEVEQRPTAEVEQRPITAVTGTSGIKASYYDEWMGVTVPKTRASIPRTNTAPAQPYPVHSRKKWTREKQGTLVNQTYSKYFPKLRDIDPVRYERRQVHRALFDQSKTPSRMRVTEETLHKSAVCPPRHVWPDPFSTTGTNASSST